MEGMQACRKKISIPFQLVAFLATQENVKLKEIKSYKTYLYSQRVQPSRMIYKHNRLNNTVLNNLSVAIPNRFTLKIKVNQDLYQSISD
ncbi:MAG: hypothetical protein DCF15_17080 [Phormidesmis priestleyi]|uniref:Uncharacterized protein n=1 Tax=Phormidesmis priestleyi TaxID=268141 RepID=A0A2W4WW15_9CYAN|nr:MAG: hypothetical protein DCF15_17080 [Phormidesmis priestleyi]